VKPKCSHHVNGRPFPGGALMRSSVKLSSSCIVQPSPNYKRVVYDKCFHCLASEHWVADCHEPRCYLSCLGVGHLAHHCKAKPHHPPPVSKPSIRSRLVFPPKSIHSHISFPKLSYARVLSATPSNTMAAAGCYVAGAPDQRPSHARTVVVVDGAMMVEL
jgi:hypothetical protein